MPAPLAVAEVTLDFASTGNTNAAVTVGGKGALKIAGGQLAITETTGTGNAATTGALNAAVGQRISPKDGGSVAAWLDLLSVAACDP